MSKPIEETLPEPTQTTLPLPLKDDPDKRGEVAANLLQGITGYLRLTKQQKMVVNAIADDFLSEVMRTDSDMARDIGIHRITIGKYKKNMLFVDVIGAMMPELVKVKLPKVLVHAVKHSEKTYKAAEFLAKFSGVYVPKSQTANLNVNVRAQSANMTPEAALHAVVDKFMAVGWSPERICQSIIDYTKSR